MGITAKDIIAVAGAEVGYLEKKTKASLDDKTANAGYNNYTKYWRDIYPSFQGQPWCDAFVDWVFIAVAGKERADEMLCGGADSYYTPTSAKCFKAKGRLDQSPQDGDQVFFSRNGTIDGIYHTGIVEKWDGTYVHTIEGNTSVTSGVVPNGGGVQRKKYLYANYKGKMLFGHPIYETPFVAYAANVTASDYLQVRTSPGGEEYRLPDKAKTSFRLPKGLTVAIVEERNGWGRLSNLQGWVSLSYLQR
jgi:hypothetical protein